MSLQKRILLAIVLCAGIFGALYCFYDNTDRGTRSMRLQGLEFHMVPSDEIEFFDDDDGPSLSDDDIIFQKHFEENECLASPDETGSPKEKLESFVRGKCAPVVVVPGFMATKLMVQIDCETLFEKHPDVFYSCGWSTCSWSLFSKMPAEEYLLWIPRLTSPMNLLRLSDNACFSHLLGFVIDRETSDISQKYKDKEGLKVTFYGNTPDTAAYADGGFGATSHLLPVPIQTVSTRQLFNIGHYFEKLGYQKGLSLFAVPYDFRRVLADSHVTHTLERTIRLAYELTGKKVVLVGHSYGNLNIVHALSKMKFEDKEKMVASYVSLGAPYGGNVKALRMIIGGLKEMIFLDLIGLQFANQKRLLTAMPAPFELLPKDIFHRFQEAPWMKELVARVNLESRYDPTFESGAEFWKNIPESEIPLSIFPSPKQKCFSINGNHRPEACMTLNQDYSKQPVARITFDTYHANQTSLESLMRRYYKLGDVDKAIDMYRDSLASGIQNLPNPEVPTVVIYGSHLETEGHIYFNYVPFSYVNNPQGQNEVQHPSMVSEWFGDGTVEVSTVLPAALKWSWEHMNNASNAKPVKIGEYCSEYNMRSTLFDSVDSNGTRVMDKSEYVGVPCMCQHSWSSKYCKHSAMLDDMELVSYLAKIAFTNQKRDFWRTGAWKLTNEELESLVETLPSLRNHRNDQNVEKWLYPRGRTGSSLNE